MYAKLIAEPEITESIINSVYYQGYINKLRRDMTHTAKCC